MQLASGRQQLKQADFGKIQRWKRERANQRSISAKGLQMAKQGTKQLAHKSFRQRIIPQPTAKAVRRIAATIFRKVAQRKVNHTQHKHFYGLSDNQRKCRSHPSRLAHRVPHAEKQGQESTLVLSPGYVNELSAYPSNLRCCQVNHPPKCRYFWVNIWAHSRAHPRHFGALPQISSQIEE